MQITMEQLGICAAGNHFRMRLTAKGRARVVTYHIRDIMEPVAGGDATAAGLILLRLMANGASEAQVRNKLTGERTIDIALSDPV